MDAICGGGGQPHPVFGVNVYQKTNARSEQARSAAKSPRKL